MKSDVITIEFVSMNETLETPSKKKKLLKDMDVQKLTGIAQRLFKTGRKIPILSIQSKVSVLNIQSINHNNYLFPNLVMCAN